MRFVLAFLFLACVAYAQNGRRRQTQPQRQEAQRGPPPIDLDKVKTPGAGFEFVRTLPADQLRDYPGHCFASTQCAVYQPGEKWDLVKICGHSVCKILEKNDRKFLVEEVHDCGPRPAKNFTHCSYVNENPEGEFPACCPTFTCAAPFDPKYLLLPPNDHRLLEVLGEGEIASA